jgi:hypothetical protein
MKWALLTPKRWIGALFCMGALLFEFLLRACRHRRQSRPFTLDNQTYKVCLDGGKELDYSLESMAPISVRERWELKMVESKRLR